MVQYKLFKFKTCPCLIYFAYLFLFISKKHIKKTAEPIGPDLFMVTHPKEALWLVKIEKCLNFIF